MRKPIKILITGDTHLGSGRVKECALSNSNEKLFGEYLDLIKDSDISITNLESPLIDKGKPILKTGPNLKSPIQTVGILKKSGFNLVTLANNHIMDYGDEGLRSTIEHCEKAGIATVGAGMNQQESQKPFIQEINELRIAILNFAENEFGTTRGDTPGAHALNPVQNYHTIKKYAGTSDYLFVIIHGGHENYSLPSPRMKETYRFFVDAGAAAVIGHHPHCYSGYEVYKDAPIFYSLGNFLFDNESNYSKWNEAYMVRFEVGNKELNFEIFPYVQNGEKEGLRKLTEIEQAQFKKKLSQLNTTIKDDEKLNKEFEGFCDSMQNQYSAYIEPHSFKYLHALRNRNLLPSFLSKRKRRLLLNLSRCEAHRDVLLKILE